MFEPAAGARARAGATDIDMPIGFMHVVVELLQSTDELVAEHAGRMIFAYTAGGEEKKTIIVEAGAVPRLVSCLASGRPRIRQYAAGALANACIKTAFKRVAMDHGALQPLVGLMRDANDRVAKQALRAVFALTSAVEARARVVNDFRAVPVIMSFLGSDDESAVENAAGALGNLSLASELRPQLVDAGVLRPLIDLCGNTSSRVLRAVAKALFALSADREAKARVVQAGGIGALVELTKCSDALVTRDATGALANLSIGADSKEQVALAGGLSRMVILLSSEASSVQKQAARGLYALSASPQNHAMLVAEKVVAVMRRILERFIEENIVMASDSLLRGITGTLGNIAAVNVAAVEVNETLPLLAAVLWKSSGLLRTEALRALRNMGVRDVVLPEWDSEEAKLADDLESLLGLASEYADVALIVEGQALPAHYFVLAVRCPRLAEDVAAARAAVEAAGGGGGARVEYTWRDVDAAAAFALLQFLYTGRVEAGVAMSPVLTGALSALAVRYALPGLLRCLDGPGGEGAGGEGAGGEGAGGGAGGASAKGARGAAAREDAERRPAGALPARAGEVDLLGADPAAGPGGVPGAAAGGAAPAPTKRQLSAGDAEVPGGDEGVPAMRCESPALLVRDRRAMIDVRSRSDVLIIPRDGAPVAANKGARAAFGLRARVAHAPPRPAPLCQL